MTVPPKTHATGQRQKGNSCHAASTSFRLERVMDDTVNLGDDRLPTAFWAEKHTAALFRAIEGWNIVW
jgi:hypothetical protein